MICPRRDELGNWSVFNLPEDDSTASGYCSFCGSMSQEDFFKKIEEGEELIPTDKNYKVYVGSAHHKFYFQHLDEDGRKRFVKLMNEPLATTKLKFAAPGYFYTLPFFLVLEKKDART